MKIDINNLVNDVFDNYIKEILDKQKEITLEEKNRVEEEIIAMFDGDLFNQSKYNKFETDKRRRYSELRQELTIINGELKMISKLRVK